MEQSALVPPVVRFGDYELDTRAGELRKGGTTTQLQEQPLQILVMLLGHPGELVTREELCKALWPADTFVDFEDSLNHAIRRLRDVLGDSADKPRFIETMPRRGYRFIALLKPAGAVREPPRRKRWVLVLGGLALIALMAVLAGLYVAGQRERLLTVSGARRAVPPPKIESIAVLPLDNLSHDPEQEYFADGMTEALTVDLGQIEALRVISRTSVLRFKGVRPAGGLPEMARQLKVDAVVEGSVLRSGDRVRITAQLIDTRTDRHVWAGSYERDLRNVLALQSEVAQAIANEIKIKVTPEVQTRLASARTVNPEAYESCLRGRQQWGKRGREGLKRGLEYFQQAIHLDPSYAAAYSGLADSYSVLAGNEHHPGTEFYPKAKAAAAKALELDENLAEAHTSLATILFDYDRDHVAALKEFRRAIELNPNYATAHHWYGLYLAYMGRSQEAFREIEQARRLDPLSPRINANVSLVLYLGRQYDRAIVEARKALELEPNDSAAHEYLAGTYLQMGMYQEALTEFQTTESLLRADSDYLALLARVYAATGNREKVLEILSNVKHRSKREYISPYTVATVYVALGEKEKAFAWLRKCIDMYDSGINALQVAPVLDPLRSDPRFQELLRRMNF